MKIHGRVLPNQCGRRRVLTLALIACCYQAQAQERVQEEVQALPEPAMAASAQASFQLNAVEFTGATVVSEGQLQALVKDYIGKQVTFADLDRLISAVDAYYQSRGVLMARAHLPVQDVVDGKVRVDISEGVLGELRIEVAEDAPISREHVERTLAVLVPGQPVNGREYERAMLLLSDLPGIRPQSGMSVSAGSNSSDILVEVAARDRMQYALQADNYGSRSSGQHRLTGSLRWASPSGRGDNLDLRLMAAQGMRTAFGRVAYETPLGYYGLRVGAGLGRVQYELGGPLAALEPTGVANVADFTLSYPLVRQRNSNVFLRAAADYKDLEDRFDAVDFQTRKRIHGLGLGLAFEHRDTLMGGGYTSGNALLYHGRLNLRDEVTRLYDEPPFGYGTAGGFTKLTIQASRLQYLAPGVSLYLSAGMQRTADNLDSYEKLSLGGPRGVRAYPIGEVLVDDGWLASAELRFGLNPDWTLSLFQDAGGGDFFHNARSIDVVKGRSLRGYGIGVNRQAPGKMAMSLSLAWRGNTGPALSDKDKNPRLYWSLQKTF